MEEVIHIYIDSIYKTETHSVTITKTRLWPSIIASQRWLLKDSFSGSTLIANGLGLMIINSLAMAVEGFLTDILIEYLDNHDIVKSEIVKKIENSNWTSKVKIYDKKFKNSIKTCRAYDSIDILLILRNNTAHGRTHTEQNAIELATSNSVKTESVNANYQKVRQFYKKNNILKDSEGFSNLETLWQIKHAWFFMSQVEIFLYSILDINYSDKIKSIKSELDNAFRMNIS